MEHAELTSEVTYQLVQRLEHGADEGRATGSIMARKRGLSISKVKQNGAVSQSDPTPAVAGVPGGPGPSFFLHLHHHQLLGQVGHMVAATSEQSGSSDTQEEPACGSQAWALVSMCPLHRLVS